MDCNNSVLDLVEGKGTNEGFVEVGSCGRTCRNNCTANSVSLDPQDWEGSSTGSVAEESTDTAGRARWQAFDVDEAEHKLSTYVINATKFDMFDGEVRNYKAWASKMSTYIKQMPTIKGVKPWK